MGKLVFFTLLSAYIFLMAITGGFAAFMALGANAPPPEMLRAISQLDSGTQEKLWGSLKAAEEKTRKLSEVATNGFQVTLGALIGFLSAVGATMTGQRSAKAGTTRNGGESDPNDIAPKNKGDA